MSIQAEQALIGCILTNNKAFELVPEIEPHHFRDQTHVTIYGAMWRDLVKGKQVDAVTVAERLTAYDISLGYLTNLMLGACSPINAPRYAEIVLEAFRRDQLKDVAFEVIGQLDERKDTTDIVGNIHKRLDGLVHYKSQEVDISQALAEHTDVMQERAEGKTKFIQTGLTDLDRKLGGGMSAGDLVILAARPSMGKTMCALTVTLNAARKGKVLFFSMEMTRSQLIDRAIANYGNVPINWVRNPQQDGPEWAAYSNASTALSRLNLVIDDRPGRKILDIIAIAKQQHRKKPVSLVVLDYLGLIRGGNSANRNLELGDYTKQLKDLAKTLDCPVLLLAQLNRGVEQRANKRPLMSDLRDSGEIEADADTIMFLYRDEYYNKDTPDKGICEIDIAKQRQGETGHVGVAFMGEYQRFDDLAFQYQRSETPKKDSTRGLD